MAPLALAPLVGAALAGTTAGGLAVASVGIGLIGAGVSAYSTIQQGKAAKASAEFQAQQQEQQAMVAGKLNAQRELESAKAEGDRLSAQRDRSLGAQMAAASASGLTISGSVIGTMTDSAIQTETDIAMVDYMGRTNAWNYSEQARSLMGTAAAGRVAGKNAYGSAKWSAAGQVVSAVAQAGLSMYGMGAFSSKAGPAGTGKFFASSQSTKYARGSPKISSGYQFGIKLGRGTG